MPTRGSDSPIWVHGLPATALQPYPSYARLAIPCPPPGRPLYIHGAAWPPPLQVFLTATVGSGDFGAVCLCDQMPPAHVVAQLGCYSDDGGAPLVRLVVGDVLERHDLSRAGLAYAHSVVIFASGGRSDDNKAAIDEGDRRSTLVRAKIAELQSRQRGRVAPVITEVHSAQAMRFLDPTMWWPEDESDEFAYVNAPAYASGHVFSPSMLHPLVGYTYFMPLLMPLLDQLIDVSDHMHLHESALVQDGGRQGIQLWLVPSLFHGAPVHAVSSLVPSRLLRCPPASCLSTTRPMRR